MEAAARQRVCAQGPRHQKAPNSCWRPWHSCLVFWVLDRGIRVASVPFFGARSVAKYAPFLTFNPDFQPAPYAKGLPLPSLTPPPAQRHSPSMPASGSQAEVQCAAPKLTPQLHLRGKPCSSPSGRATVSQLLNKKMNPFLPTAPSTVAPKRSGASTEDVQG